MSKIEREIVQMSFDGKDFQKGVNNSIQDLARLNGALELDNASRSFGELEKASRVDFSAMASSLESINSKLSLTGIAAAAVVTRITGAIIDAGKALANTVILTPLKTGLEEYETQLNAVQTILANTSKDNTTLEQVTGALNELNTYADKTIYNFTQMTDSIGKFTTAGVDLETSTSAIKGIANVAALSGSNANQASTAMYQLSQAISSGTIRLQDWISVENAGMGGQLFKDALVATARLNEEVDGQIDKLIEKSGGFRQSLSEGWLTAEVMLQTLSTFTGDLTDAELLDLGYAQDDIAEIQKTAEMANDAATKIKTFTQLQDTLAEALQSGWSQSWQLIFGDFEQAKEMWGQIGDIFGDLIGQQADARNQILKTWGAMGGRDVAVRGVMNTLEAMVNLLGHFGDAWAEVFEGVDAFDLVRISQAFETFSEALLKASKEAGPFKSIVRGVAAAIDIVKMAIEAIAAPIVEVLKGVLPEGAQNFLDMAVNIADSIFEFRNFAKETDYFGNIVRNVIAYVKDVIAQIKEAVEEFKQLEIAQDVTKWLEGLERPDFVKIWGQLTTAIKAAAVPIYVLGLAIQRLYRDFMALEQVQDAIAWVKNIDWGEVAVDLQAIADSARNMIESLRDNETIGKFKEYFATFDGRRFTQFLEDAREGFDWLLDIVDRVNEALGDMNQNTAETTENVSGISDEMTEKLQGFMDKMIASASQIDYSKIFEVINTGLLAGLVLAVRSIASGNWLNDALRGVFGDNLDSIVESITDMFGGLEGTLTTFQKNVKSDTLKNIAVAIALLAGSIVLLTYVDSTKLLAATGAIGAMTAALFGSAGALGRISTQDMIKAAIGINGMALSLVLVSGALKMMDGFDAGNIEVTLAAMVGGLSALVVGVRVLSAGENTGGLIKTIGILLGLTGALYGLSVVMKKFADLKPDELAQGLAAVAATLTLITVATSLLARTGEKSLLVSAFALTDTAVALNILATAVGKFGDMDAEPLRQGLMAIGAALVGFAVFSQLLKPQGLISASIGLVIMSGAMLIVSQAVQSFAGIGWDALQTGLLGMAGAMLILVVAGNAMSGALAGAAATLVMSVSILALAAALTVMSKLDLPGLGIAFLAIAGTFTLLGVAGLLMAPVVPILLGLGAAMALIGLGSAAFGAGILAASTGLVALAASSTTIGLAIGAIGVAIGETLPGIGRAIAEAMTNFLQTIAENAPKIVEAMSRIIVGMVESVANAIPEIVAVVLDMVTQMLKAVASRLPEMIQSGYEILLAWLQGIADNVQEIVATGIMIVTEIINGISQAIPDLIDSAFNLILTFLNAMADAIGQYTPQILAAGVNIGAQLVAGVVKGLMAGLSKVVQAAKDLVNAAVGAAKAAAGIESPSKETYAIGGYMVDGLVNAVTDGTPVFGRALEDLVQKGQNGIKPLVNALDAYLQESFDREPVIKPVLDLSDVDRGLTNTFGGSVVGAAVMTRVQQRSDRSAGYATGGATLRGGNEPAGVTYVQNNYSPKALDRAQIYRQTRTQLARAAVERSI